MLPVHYLEVLLPYKYEIGICKLSGLPNKVANGVFFQGSGIRD